MVFTFFFFFDVLLRVSILRWIFWKALLWFDEWLSDCSPLAVDWTWAPPESVWNEFICKGLQRCVLELEHAATISLTSYIKLSSFTFHPHLLPWHPKGMDELCGPRSCHADDFGGEPSIPKSGSSSLDAATSERWLKCVKKATHNPGFLWSRS